jgi:F-box and leucine-rich repeat protein 14
MLQHLDLSGCKRVLDSRVAHLKGLTGLQHLNLRGCKKVTESGIAHLRSFEVTDCTSTYLGVKV